jgi:hypothetical protein
LKVPATRVAVRAESVMKPAWPLIGVVHDSGVTMTVPVPPGVVPVLTPSGCVAGPMKKEIPIERPRPLDASKPVMISMPSRVGVLMPVTEMKASSLAQSTPSMTAVNELPPPPPPPPPGLEGPSLPPQPTAINSGAHRSRATVRTIRFTGFLRSVNWYSPRRSSAYFRSMTCCDCRVLPAVSSTT